MHLWMYCIVPSSFYLFTILPFSSDLHSFSHLPASFFIITFISCTHLLSFPSPLPAAPLKEAAALPVCLQPANSAELYNSTIIIPTEAVNCHRVSLSQSQAPLLFHPFFIPIQHSPCLTTFFKSQTNTSKTTVITLNIVLALSQAVIIIIPPPFLLHPGNYTQLFLIPVCCFLLLSQSIHLSLSSFSFSSIVSLCFRTLRLSLYLSLRWFRRGGNGRTCWLKQGENQNHWTKSWTPVLFWPLRDNPTCFQTHFYSLEKSSKLVLRQSTLCSREFRFRGFHWCRRWCITTEMGSLLGGTRVWKHTSISADSPKTAQMLKASSAHVQICTDTGWYTPTFNTLTFNGRMWGGKCTFNYEIFITVV